MSKTDTVQSIPIDGLPLTEEEWSQTDREFYTKSFLLDRYKDDFDKLPHLEQRMDQYFDDFWVPFRSLYGDSLHSMSWVIRIFDLIVESLKERPAHLNELDEVREQSPDWFKSNKLVGAMLYVDLFAGDLKNLKEKITYLNELGINYLHLMPISKPREGLNDGGYAVESYREVDPRVGTIEDLREFANLLHDAGINLVLDFVMNHTAREHEWAQRAMNGDERYQHYYYVFDDRTIPDQYEQNLVEVFPDFAPGNFSYYPQMDKWVWTTFYEFQWDLNYSNPEVFHAMLGEMMFLANLGVDVLRLDAVPYTWKKMGTNCQNLPEAHMLVQAYRALVRIFSPSLIFKAEAIVGPEEIVKYLGVGGNEGKECDAAYNATLMNHLWHALACENTHLLRTTLFHLPRAPHSSVWLNYIRCHDDIGWGISDENAAAVNQNGHNTRMYCTDFYTGKLSGSYAEGYPFQRDYWSGEARVSGTAAALAGLQKSMVEGEGLAIEDAANRILLLKNIIFTWKGIPLLYMGDEIGQMNDFSYLGEPTKKGDNRWVHRPYMNWGKAELRKYPDTVENRLFRGIQRLVKGRQNSPVLHGDSLDRILMLDHDSLFAFERRYGNSKLLLISNFSGDKTVHIKLDELPEEWRYRYYRNFYDNRVLDFSFGEIVIEPYGFFWLEPSMKPEIAPVTDTTIIDVIAETNFGEEIYIVGNIPQLGEWDPNRSIGPLKPLAYPNWEIEVDLPANTFFEFQWIKKRNGKILEWSPDKYWMKSGDEISYY